MTQAQSIGQAQSTGQEQSTGQAQSIRDVRKRMFGAPAAP